MNRHYFIRPVHYIFRRQTVHLVSGRADAYSRWIEAFDLESVDDKYVAQDLCWNIFIRCGYSGTIICDHGTHFCEFSGGGSEGHIWHEMLQNKTVLHIDKWSLWAVHSFIHSSLKTYVNDSQSDWLNYLPSIMMAFLRSPATRSTEFRAFFMAADKLSWWHSYCLINTDVAYPYHNEL